MYMCAYVVAKSAPLLHIQSTLDQRIGKDTSRKWSAGRLSITTTRSLSLTRKYISLRAINVSMHTGLYIYIYIYVCVCVCVCVCVSEREKAAPYVRASPSPNSYPLDPSPP